MKDSKSSIELSQEKGFVKGGNQKVKLGLSHVFDHQGWSLGTEAMYTWKYDHREVARFASKMTLPVHQRVTAFVSAHYERRVMSGDPKPWKKKELEEANHEHIDRMHVAINM